MDIAAVLPLAFVMIAGPQIISAFFFATSERWKPTSAAYVVGGAISITAVITAAYLLSKGVDQPNSDEKAGLQPTDYVILALLAFVALRNFRKRGEAEPPAWMGKLQAATPKFAFVLGLLLLGVFPSDLVTSISVGGHLENRGDPWWYALPFVGLTALLLALPAICVALLGPRARTLLPRARDWMTANSWIVSEVVIVFFAAIIVTG